MKRGWKITLISLGSLLGLVVVTLVVALWLVFTPKQLTKIVNSLAGDFINCDTKFENVDLTLLSTFPDAGLKVSNVVLLNPKEGAPSDTLARVGSLVVGIDVRAFIKENKVIVHQVKLDDAKSNLYIAKDGSTNFDVFPSSEDTSSSELPELIDLKKVKISDLNLCFKDERDGMDAVVEGLDLSVKGAMKEMDIDADAGLGVRHLTFAMGGERPTMKAMVENLALDLEGKWDDPSADADLALKGERVQFQSFDSVGVASLATVLDEWKIKLKGKGGMDSVDGTLVLAVKHGTLNAGGTEMVNATLQDSREKLLVADIPFKADLKKMLLKFGESALKIDDYALKFSGETRLPSDSTAMAVDMKLATDGAWRLKELLAIVPECYRDWQKGMDVNGKVILEATAKGALSDSTMPVVDARVRMDDGTFTYPQSLPYKLKKISGDIAAHLDMGVGGKCYAVVHSLSARANDSKVSITGRADDLTGDMRLDATLKGAVPLRDVLPLLPDTLPVKASGEADLNLHAKLKMSQLQAMNIEKMVANGTLKLKGLDVTYDSLHATAPQLDLAIQLPAKEHKGKLADVRLTGSGLKVNTLDRRLNAKLDSPDIKVGVNNIMKSQPALAFNIAMGEAEATKDSMLVSLGALALKGSIRMDSTQENVLKRFNPVVDLSTHSLVLDMPIMKDAIRMSQFAIDYTPKSCEIKKAEVKMGHSDFQLYGSIDNLEEWLSDKAMLKGDLNFTSSYADIDQLMNLFSGLGNDADSLDQMRIEDNVPSEANPFIVPKNVDLTIHTHIRRSVAFGNDLNDLAGALTVRDGVAVLDQIGFVCKAATMQLTALYRSPRPNHLFTAIDFHLLDIQIDELLDMIPCVDTLVPMLSAFNGKANFHLAGEGALDAFYRPKMSTLLGSMAITGKDLVVMEDQSVAKMAKLMKLKNWKEKDNKIRIDSLSVEATCLRKEVEVYPFILHLGSYQFCASGLHKLDGNCVYHVELLKNPLLAKVGVDIKGTLSSPKISLGEVRYADYYKPTKQGVLEKQIMKNKALIREALERNVR